MRDIGDAYALVWALTFLAAAAFTVIPGADELARDWLDAQLKPAAHPPSLLDVLELGWHNVRICGWPLLLGVLGAQQRSWSQAVAHAAVAASLLVNTVPVGAAVGGYGHRILAYLPHLPVEWAALAIGAGGWWTIAHNSLPRRQAIATVGFLLTAVLLAALLELTCTPHH